MANNSLGPEESETTATDIEGSGEPCDSEDNGHCESTSVTGSHSLNAYRVSHEESNGESKEDIYDILQLGLFQKLFFRLTNNMKLSVHISMCINIITSIIDVATDMLLLANLLRRGLYILSLLVFSADFLPGVVLIFHHSTSSVWGMSSNPKRVASIALLLIQPFSVLLTGVLWWLSLSSNHRHYMFRLATLLAGCIEGPMQFIWITYMWSHGFLALPWGESTVVVDRYQNYVNFGQTGTISMAFTTIGILKASIDVFEAYEDKLNVMIFTWTNTLFRLLSFAFVIQFFELYSIPLFLTLLLVNVVVFLRNQQKASSVSTITSILCAVIIPVTMVDQPHMLQRSSRVAQKDEENTEKETPTEVMKLNSFWIAIITGPLILLADIMVAISIKYFDWRHGSIWSDQLMLQWVQNFFIPTFVLAYFSTFLIIPQRYSLKKCLNTFLNKHKVKVICLILVGMITTVIIHGIYTPKINYTMLGYKDAENRLNVFEAASIDHISASNYCKTDSEARYITCQGIKFNFTDYRKVTEFQPNKFYVDFEEGLQFREEIATASEGNASFYVLGTIYGWGQTEPEELKEGEVRCKRCYGKRIPPNRCTTFVYGLSQFLDCEGKFVLLLGVPNR